MKKLPAPANLTIMDLTPKRLALIKPVTALDIDDGGLSKFHDDGLFSTVIFGRVGSDERDTRFSYIDLKAEIFHPFIFQQLVALRSLYGGIMQGKAFAIWNDKEKDFEPSDMGKGQTGYSFFFKHWKEIVFKRTGSRQRDERIALVNKFKDKATLTKFVVGPAGLRDLQVEADGRTREGEINEFYRGLLRTANSIGTTGDLNDPILDNSRYSLQMNANNVFDFVIDAISGKGGFLQNKWGSRNIIGGTRNVITSMDTSTAVLGDKYGPKQNNTVLGLFQHMKDCTPLVKNALLTGVVGKAFKTTDGIAYLVDRETLQQKQVQVRVETRDRWATTNGLDSVINNYREPTGRARPVMIEGNYLALIYRPKDTMVYRIFTDIRELPPHLSKEDVYPLTYCEMFYLETLVKISNLAMFVTRFPIAGTGSSPPSIPYVKNTIVSERRRRLGEDWKPEESDVALAVEYPILNGPDTVYFDSMSIHPSRLGAAGADHDGDMMSANGLTTKDGVKEIHDHLNTVKAYVHPSGGLRASAAVDTVDRVLVALSTRRK